MQTAARQGVSVRVRAATEGDAPFLVCLAGQAYRDLVTRQFGAWHESEQAARFAAKVERLPFQVGEVAGRPVAAVSSSVHADHVFLDEILVLPEFQNRGLGSELLEREIRGARQLGLPLRLHTLKSNPAVRLFERHGFCVTARGDVYVDLEHAVDSARSRERGSPRSRADISLIVPAHNESAFLGRTLESVNDARDAYGDPSAIEVVVVDNVSTDDTGEIASTHGARVLVEPRRCIAAVRNRGARESTGRIVAFLDADSLVSRGVFNSIRETMSGGDYAGGSTGVRLERMSAGLFVTMCMTVYPSRWLLGVSGGLFFAERSVFEEVGGFDERLFAAEDSAFLLALRRNARQSGRRLAILKGDVTTTSARSFDRFGDWYYLANLPRIILNGGVRAFRSPEFCRRFWYDTER